MACHSVVISADGKVYSWGMPFFTQCTACLWQNVAMLLNVTERVKAASQVAVL